MGVSVQGEMATHRRGASQGLGEERRTGEKEAFYNFNLVCLWVLN